MSMTDSSHATRHSSKPWSQTASGKAFVFGQPVTPGMLDIRRDIAGPLGMTGRFTNQMPGGVIYSVAQHCVIGADVLLTQTGDYTVAMAFLIHDGHEALLGDQTSPYIAALQVELDALREELGAGLVPRISINHLRKRVAEPIDRWLHEEAGLPWPLPRSIANMVHLADRQLLLAERQHLLNTPPRPWDEALEKLRPMVLKHPIKPMPPAKASEAWTMRFEAWAAKLHAARRRPALTYLTNEEKSRLCRPQP